VLQKKCEGVVEWEVSWEQREGRGGWLSAFSCGAIRGCSESQVTTSTTTQFREAGAWVEALPALAAPQPPGHGERQCRPSSGNRSPRAAPRPQRP
jgi:hypothetical protein